MLKSSPSPGPGGEPEPPGTAVWWYCITPG